jgi:hypothetical protein
MEAHAPISAHPFTNPVRTRLRAGGRWIRTIGTPPNFFGRPSIPAQFTFRNINRLARDRDLWFESISLQRGVRCEPDFRGRIPPMAVGRFRRLMIPLSPARSGISRRSPRPFELSVPAHGGTQLSRQRGREKTSDSRGDQRQKILTSSTVLLRAPID